MCLTFKRLKDINTKNSFCLFSFLHQMVLELCLCSRHNISPGNPEGADQPEEKEDDLDATDDGEPSEEPHGASNETQLSLHLDLLVSLDVVEGGCVKVDLNQMKG